nr:polysaccharide deacetylase family protein [Lysinibacillus timonensis]
MLDVNNGSYDANILGARKAINQILSLFNEYEIHATWATVGLLFCETKKDMVSKLFEINPTYENTRFNPISYLKQVGEDELNDPLHFGKSLIYEIKEVPHQEIATHTFSHFYCLEDGQTIEQFKKDLLVSIEVHEKYNLNVTSIVFPRNQINNEYLKVCQDLGIFCYRGNAEHPLHKARKHNIPLYIKVLKHVDSYINISGSNAYHLEVTENRMINIRESMFLRPYRTKWLEHLKYKRISKSMELAAKEKKIFHLWWHPHNFGQQLEENLLMLRKILEHYNYLNEKYDFQSYTMSEFMESTLCNASNKRILQYQ